ncbi:MAG: hypothetical protein H6822_13325 [Planctomycetaceae bacterium]|nr:hypothetical protein [Planctomycetales bacterium]MCB9923159.1 hypothetical protein [Planctomycetaceae bacterium]
MSPLIEGRVETAFLAFVDSDGKQIKEFKPSMSSRRIAESVRELVAAR